MLYICTQGHNDRTIEAAARVVDVPLLLHYVVPDISNANYSSTTQRFGLRFLAYDCHTPKHRNRARNFLDTSRKRDSKRKRIRKGCSRIVSLLPMVFGPAVGIGAKFHHDSLASVRGAVKYYRPTCFLRREKGNESTKVVVFPKRVN